MPRTMFSVIAAIAIAMVAGVGSAAAIESGFLRDKVAVRGASASCEDRSCPPNDKLSGGPRPFVSDDSKSRYVALVVNKSVALDLSSDVSDVFIANPDIADAVLRTSRRAFVIAKKLGQTNIYFYDAHGRQIEGINLNIGDDHEIEEIKPEETVTVVRGQGEKEASVTPYICAGGFCQKAERAHTDKAPPPIIVLPNMTSVAGAIAATAK